MWAVRFYSVGSCSCVWRPGEGTRRQAAALFSILMVTVMTFLLPVESAAAPMKEVRRVLILYELGLSSPAVTVLDREILATLENSPFQIELYREFLETTLFPDPAAQREFRESYVHKYHDRRPDLIIAVGPSPIKFMVDLHEKAFKGIPVVFGGSFEQLAELDDSFTGVWENPEPKKTLEVALRLRPQTRHVVVVAGTSAYDRSAEAIFRESLRSYENTLDFAYTTDLDMPTLVERLKHLPEGTIILYCNFEQDAAGTKFVEASQADPIFASVANAPIFTPSDVDWGHGEVGGYVHSFAQEGKLVGNISAAILNGKRPKDIPIVRGANVYLFDWRALQRWGLDEKNLPAGSIVLNRQPGFWEAYKRYVIVAVGVLLAQTVAILALLWQRARRRKMEAELQKSEEKFSKAFQRSPLAFTLVSLVDYRFVEVNDTFERYTGWKRNEVVGRSTLEINLWVDTDQRSAFLAQLAEGAVRNAEILFRTKDGRVRTGQVSSERIDLHGEPCALSLVADITEAKNAEQARLESENRFRLVANSAPVMIWMSGPDKKPTYFNQLWLDFTGLSETDLQNGLAEIVHPDDYQQCHGVYCRGFDQRQPFKKECRLRRHDGQYRSMLDIGVPRLHKDGSFAGYIGSCIDVTDQKLAEEAISAMTRKLVEAQEQERTRIARELHDDINQRLAMLAVELEQLQDDPSHVRSRVQELRKQTTEISNGVQALSHDLHSSQLEYLGAVAGMKSWCKEFAERQGMQIDYRHDVQSTLPQEIGLCLFRVLQEALHNAAKHSGVIRVEVQLREDSGEIHLTIRDLGKGFDVETAKQGRGLGLTSMRERVRLVNGTIDIQSKPMSGTTIHARVPFTSEHGAQRLAV